MEPEPVEPDPGEITLLLQELRRGDQTVEERLIVLVYKELRRLAASYLRKEAADHSLQPTALVHEAYLRLAGMHGKVAWQNRTHFFAVAAKVMRHILVDNARANQAKKRGDGYTIVGLEEAFVATPERPSQVLALDEALNRLALIAPRQVQIIELRFFGGLTEKEVAELLGISVKTVQREWAPSRAWLFRELSLPPASVPSPLSHSAL